MKKFFILFAATCIASAAWADVVFEPLIVSSGFNRDVIAEKTPVGTYASSYYEYGKTTQHIFATKSVIEAVNNTVNEDTGKVDADKKLTDAEKELLKNVGWPDDNGGSNDRRINCQSSDHQGLYWDLAPYNDKNALCLKNDGKTGETNTGTLTFKNVGCFQRLYFLTFA